MRRARLGLVLGVTAALIGIGACALDESGSYSDGGVLPDVIVQNDASLDMNAAEDVTYDVPDLGVGETESGLPCTCVIPPDAGNYVYVEYTPTSRPNCDSPAYANHVDWQEVMTWTPDTCSCVCNSPQPPPGCSCGNTPTFAISSGNGNCTDVTDASLQAAQAPGCDKSSQTLNPGSGEVNNMKASLGQATCAPFGGGCGNPTKNITSGGTPTIGMGRACPLQAATSTCNGGNVCVPTQGAPYSLCVTNMTNDPCPSDFPVRHLVGTGTQDNRGCGPSTCGPGSCTIVDSGTCGVPQIVLSPNDNNCGGTTVTLPVDNTTCVQTSFGDSVTIDSTRYTITQSGGACGLASAFNPTGGVVATGGYAICCQP
jgi:hypothetical protein